MHLPDGFLSPQLTVPAYGVAAPLWAWAARRYFGHDAAEALPVVGSLTALAFAVQSIAVPVPGGTTTHLVGVALLALLYPPPVAFVCESLVLAVQALFFGTGGLTVLAVNALAMGLAGPLAAWIVHRLVRRASERVAAFLAGWVAMQASTGAIVLVLALQQRVAPRYFPVPLPVTVAAMMIPSLTVGGLLEGLYTVFALSLLRKANLRGVPLRPAP